MESRELRIGNKVQDNNGFIFDVVSVFEDGTIYCDFKGNEGDVWEFDNNNPCEPILLSEEILLKCGFVRRGITSNNGSKLTLHHKDNMFPNGRVYWNSWCISDSIPEHLHQLQNLYFALTGEELEINL